MRKKQTKIVATISDLKCDVAFLRTLHDHGMDVVRLNTAHQNQEATLKVINNVRETSERIALLVDTKGPELRTSKFEFPIEVKTGDIVKIKGGKSEDISSRDMIYINYPHFVKDIPVNTSILIDDGELELKVTKKEKDYLVCRAMNNAPIKQNKSVNVPGVHINLPSLSSKDLDYIDFAIKHDLDFIAHSFVRNKEDIIAIQKILDKKNSKIKIIAKVENREGVDNIDEIIDHAYGIMVARGDLGIEIPAEEIPLIQKMMIKKCISKHKPVITATQMMHTMIKNPRPTRAEVSDVANAILDGTDAIMLSGETAYGEYPVEAVSIMSKIARQVEGNTDFDAKHLPAFDDENTPANYLAKSAVIAAKELNAKEIIISAITGFSAKLIASYRSRVPVFVKSHDKKNVRELSLTYGINANFVKPEANFKTFISKILTELVSKGKLAQKDLVIFLARDGNESTSSTFMEICEVGKHIKKITPKNKS